MFKLHINLSAAVRKLKHKIVHKYIKKERGEWRALMNSVSISIFNILVHRGFKINTLI
jgi:hypothetical protein